MLQFAGVDPLQAGNVVQLFIVLGLTVGWISTYMFRVANKDMTYAQQLRDYEKKVMEVSNASLSTENYFLQVDLTNACLLRLFLLYF